ncbi:MAG: epoxide hydrolase 4 [Actinomycetota bacterium]|nr:epoxide hydrolase 4 [Actinomycetota bacterium]
MVTNGIRLWCLEAGPPDAPLVLLMHGFPEIAYSWRNQIGPLGAAGFHVIAPDMPGYGRSDKPDVRYDCEWINGTLIGLVDALGHDRVVIAGHDWGGLLVWIMARQYPERIAGVIGLNTPDLPRPPVPPIQLLRSRARERPYYLEQFQDRGVAEWVFSWGGRAHDDFVEMTFRGPATVVGEAFPPDVLNVYKRAFRAAGALTPPLEYYRNMDRNWELTAPIADRKIEVPCLMIGAEGDRVLKPAMADGMEDRVPNLEKIVLANCGHWTQQERPRETTAAMLAYLKRLDRW